MGVPSNAVQITGQGQVDGDQLNTFVQTCNVMSDLRAFIGVDGMQVSVLGQDAVNDLGGGTFYWNVNGTAPDDNGLTTVVPNGSASGEWTRVLPITLTPATPERFTISPGLPPPTTSTTGIMMGLAVGFTPAISGDFILSIEGSVFNTVALDGCTIALRYGDSIIAPTGGQALTGTVLAATFMISATASQSVPFCLMAYLGGLTIGKPYWLDLGLAAFTGGQATVQNITATVVEQ